VDNEKSKEVLTYTELLSIFGAEEMENQLLSDQGGFFIYPNSNDVEFI